ncbi:hypothetical protein BH09PLA1_BH09PLA1_14840 [soil metagenome]
MIVLLALALRLPGMFTDFWLDEIWSLNVAKSIHSPLDVLLSESARIDNNHPLHTWYLCAVGDVNAWWIYRLPAFVCGLGAVIVAAIAFARRSAIESIVAAALIAFSFPLVFYSTEARGYAPVVFFALVSFGAMLRYVDRASWSSAAIFNLACVLGFLSHLTFFHFYLAAMYWTVLRARRTRLPLMQQFIWWARLNAVPVLFLVFLFRVFVRDMTIGGAAPTDPVQVLFRSLSIPLGGPDFGAGAIVGACITIALFVASIANCLKRRDDLWLFYVLAVVVAPGFLLFYNLVLSARPQPLMPRYFLVAMTMLLMAIAHLAPLLNRRVLCVAMAMFFLANGLHMYRATARGRGNQTQVIHRLLRESSDSMITVSTDDFRRARMVMGFYGPRLVPQDRGIEIRESDQPAEWILTTSPSPELSGFFWEIRRR